MFDLKMNLEREKILKEKFHVSTYRRFYHMFLELEKFYNDVYKYVI